MPDLYEICWNVAKDELLIDRAAYLQIIRSWAASPVYAGDELSAVLIEKGAEVHIFKVGAHPITRQQLRDTLGKVLTKHGWVTTTVPSDDVASRDFVRRLGFNFTGSDDSDHFYKLERLRHV